MGGEIMLSSEPGKDRRSILKFPSNPAKWTRSSAGWNGAV